MIRTAETGKRNPHQKSQPIPSPLQHAGGQIAFLAALYQISWKPEWPTNTKCISKWKEISMSKTPACFTKQMWYSKTVQYITPVEYYSAVKRMAQYHLVWDRYNWDHCVKSNQPGTERRELPVFTHIDICNNWSHWSGGRALIDRDWGE